MSSNFDFNDEINPLILLSSLPNSQNSSTTVVSNSPELRNLTFDEVCSSILSEDIHRKAFGKALTAGLTIVVRI